MLREGRGHAVAHPELETAIRAQPALQRQRLLHEESVVRGGVDRAVEALVLVVVVVGIRGEAGDLARAVRLQQRLLVGLQHPSRRQPGTHRFELGHQLEHLEQALRRDVGDHRAPARAHDDDAHRGELDQRLAQGRPRDAEQMRELDLVEMHPRGKAPGGDLVLDRLAKRLGARRRVRLLLRGARGRSRRRGRARSFTNHQHIIRPRLHLQTDPRSTIMHT